MKISFMAHFFLNILKYTTDNIFINDKIDFDYSVMNSKIISLDGPVLQNFPTNYHRV